MFLLSLAAAVLMLLRLSITISARYGLSTCIVTLVFIPNSTIAYQGISKAG